MAAPGEILVELTRDSIEPLRGVQQSGADAVGEVLQHRVMPFAAEGHSHQPHRCRGDEQCADGGVERPVGDVEKVVAVGGSRKPGVQAGDVVVIDRVERGEVNCGHW